MSVIGIGLPHFPQISENLENYRALLYFSFNQNPLIKRRYVTPEGKHLARVDDRKRFSRGEVYYMTQSVSGMDLSGFKAIIFSDYDKGTITPELVKLIKTKCPNVLTIVDSKREELSLFKGMDVLKLNESEFSRQISLMCSKEERHVTGLFKHVVETRGEKGSRLYEMMSNRAGRFHGMKTSSSAADYTVQVEDFPIKKEKEVDVTGCGDTHTATIAYCLARGANIRDSVRLANQVASKVVSKFGTSIPDENDLASLRSFFLSRQDNL